MSTKYPGGLIRKTPPTITPPTGVLNPEGGSAPGMWTLEQASYYTKIGTWPKPAFTRELFAWGNNFSGQLGQNNLTYRSSPVQVGAFSNWMDIACGIENVAAIKNDGTLWTWGTNTSGQLGLNITSGYRSSPTQVGALTNWAKVGSGTSNIYAIKTNGTLWAWGLNTSGECGTNDSGSISVYSSPVQVGTLTNWSDVIKSPFANYCLAINLNNQLFSFGTNNVGQLGQNDTINRSSPVQVGALTNWKRISTGTNSSFAIKTDGTLWAWTQNQNGQSGTNNLSNQSSPVQVGALTTWNYIGSTSLSCIATKTDGTLWSWGKNDQGQLGQNNSTYRSSPVQVGSLTNWLYVSGGKDFCFAITSDKKAWSWGNNQNGQLGQGDTIKRSSPVQIGARTVWEQTASGDIFGVLLTKY